MVAKRVGVRLVPLRGSPFNTRSCSQATRATQDIVYRTVDRAGDTTEIPVDNRSPGDSRNVPSPEHFRPARAGETPARRSCESHEPCGGRGGRCRTGGSSVDALREHLARVLAHCRHQHMKRRFNHRIVSIEIGGCLLELPTESRPTGKPRECSVEPGSGRVQTQPSTLEHAFEPRPVPDRNDVGLSLHLGADMLHECVEAHRRVVRPAPRETVVEEYVHDDPGVASAGSGDISQARLERVVAISEPIDGAVECDSDRDAGRYHAIDPPLDEVRADVPGAYLVVVGRQQRVGEEVHGTTTGRSARARSPPAPDRPLRQVRRRLRRRRWCGSPSPTARRAR